jgi:nucleoside phosphorylase
VSEATVTALVKAVGKAETEPSCRPPTPTIRFFELAINNDIGHQHLVPYKFVMASFQTTKRSRDGRQLASHYAKRPRRGSGGQSAHLGHNDYTVGWLCALSLEMAAAEAMLDAKHPALPRDPDDSNGYTLGNIGPHNIAIACLPQGHYGTNNAAIVAGNMRRSFPSLDIRLMVGIGGGLPGSVDLRLGDVVVGEQVIQYDLVKAMPGGQIHRISVPTRPPQTLMTYVSKLKARHAREACRIPRLVSDMVDLNPPMVNYAHPRTLDRLFQSTYAHDSANGSCGDCDQTQLVERPERPDEDPKIFYGKIASANTVVKDSVQRNKLADELGMICFEMEAAGLVDHFPCLVIRGICDYADSHKAKDWQNYAAATAAAYAKEFLMEIPECQRRVLPAESSYIAAGVSVLTPIIECC